MSDCPRYRVGPAGPSDSPPTGEVWSYSCSFGHLVFQPALHEERTGIFNGSSPTCMLSNSPRSDFSGSNDHKVLSFVQTIWLWSVSCARPHDGSSSSPVAYSYSSVLCFYFLSYSREAQFHCWLVTSFWFLALSSSCTTGCPWGNSSTSVTAGPASCGLTEKCRFYLTNDLASSTRQVYASAQPQFLDFATRTYLSVRVGLPCRPAMRFCTHLADRIFISSSLLSHWLWLL